MIFLFKGPGTLHSQPVLKGMFEVKQPLFHGKGLGTIIQLKQPFIQIYIQMDGLQVPERLENLQVKQP